MTRIENRAPSVPKMFLDRVAATPSTEAFRYPDNGGWTSVTWSQVGDRVELIAAGLISLGINAEDRVALASGTRYEWVVVDFGILSAGAATTTVYPTTNAEDVAFIVANSGSRVVVAENQTQVDKLVEHRSEIPAVEKVVIIDGAGDGDWVITLEELEQLGKHGGFDLAVEAQGDLEVDTHHTVEDVGIVLGQAIAEAVGEKRGIQRYGHAYVPLDEALSRVVIDLSGRPGLFYRVEYTRSHVGRFDVDLIREFFQGLVNSARMTVHLDCLQGTNSHHIAETLFKAFGRALRMALTHDPRAQDQVPSTKGTLASSLSVDTRSG